MSLLLANMIKHADHIKLPAIAKILLIHLAGYARDDGTSIYPSLSRLAREMDKNRSTIQRNMKILVERGYIKNTRKYSAVHLTTNHYEIVMNMIHKPVDNSVDKSCITLHTYRQIAAGTYMQNAPYKETLFKETLIVGATDVDAPPQQPISQDVFEMPMEVDRSDPTHEVFNHPQFTFFGRPEWTKYTNRYADGTTENHTVLLVGKKSGTFVLEIPKHGQWAVGYENELIRLIAALRGCKLFFLPIAANG